MPRWLNQPLVKLLAVIAVIAAFVIYVRTAARLPPPVEKNRVISRVGGYSIIKPQGWEEKLVYSAKDRKFQDMLELRPKESKGGMETRIFLGRFREPPDLEMIRQRDQQIDTSFQGHPAQVFTGQTKREFYWRAIIERGGQWYELVLWLPLRENVPGSEWWPYLTSFRAPDSPPASSPSPLVGEGKREG